MALFQKSDPTVTIERKLNDKIAHRLKLVARLNQSEAALVAATKAADAVADAAADDDGRARARKRDCEDDVKGRQDALAKCDAEIAVLKTDLAKAVEVKTRAETVTAAGTLLNDFATVMDEFGTVLARAEPIVRKVAAIAPGMTPLHTFFATVRVQAPDAKAQGCREGQDYINAVKHGSAPAQLKQPEVPQPKQAPIAQPQLTTVFAWHPLTWLDHHNQQRTIAKWREVDLPPAAAAYALEAGLALLNTDPRCNDVRNQSPGHPEAAWLNDLDKKVGPNIPDSAAAAQPAADPIRSSATQFDVKVGEAKIIQWSRG